MTAAGLDPKAFSKGPKCTVETLKAALLAQTDRHGPLTAKALSRLAPGLYGAIFKRYHSLAKA